MRDADKKSRSLVTAKTPMRFESVIETWDEKKNKREESKLIQFVEVRMKRPTA